MALLLSLSLDVPTAHPYIYKSSDTERPRKTKIGTEVAYVTRDSDTTFKVKRYKTIERQYCRLNINCVA